MRTFAFRGAQRPMIHQQLEYARGKEWPFGVWLVLGSVGNVVRVVWHSVGEV